LSAAGGFLGLAVGFWILYISAGFALVALIGWVFEYSRGDHAHSLARGASGGAATSRHSASDACRSQRHQLMTARP
jgi:hypothetical protein